MWPADDEILISRVVYLVSFYVHLDFLLDLQKGQCWVFSESLG